MRLKKTEIAALAGVLAAHLNSRKAKLYLFGSRAQPRLKGGDIDLLLLASAPTTAYICDRKHIVLSEFKKELGERRIDLTIAEDASAGADPFISHILKTAVLLREWSPRT